MYTIANLYKYAYDLISVEINESVLIDDIRADLYFILLTVYIARNN